MPIPDSKAFWRVPPVVLGVLVVTALFSALIFSGSELAFTQTTEIQQQQRHLSEARSQALLVQSLVHREHNAYWAYTTTGIPSYLNDVQQAGAQALMHYGLLKGSLPPNAPEHALVAPLGELLQDNLEVLSQTALPDPSVRAVTPSAALAQAQTLLDKIQQLDEALQTHGQAVAADLSQTLLRQRIGLAVLVGLNLIFLSSLAAKTLRHFYDHERQRMSFSNKTQALEEAILQRTAELHELTTYLQRQGELEKSSLARELHDELGSLLTAAKLELAWLEGRNPGSDPARTERLKKLSKILDQALNLKRKVVDNLRPSLLDHLGLTVALPWYVQETCDRAGLVHHVQVPDEGLDLDMETALALYRIVQEALNNTIQHARAHAVWVALYERGSEISLTYRDDGIGIRDLHPDHLSHGIAGMRHRAMAIGGKFQVQSEMGIGTFIQVRIPNLQPSSKMASASTPEATSPPLNANHGEASTQQAMSDCIPGQVSVAG